MNLRELAAKDFASIVSDEANGFGWPVAIKSPTGIIARLVTLTTDISQLVDPETGHYVTGRKASSVVPMISARAAFNSLPIGVADSYSKPWILYTQDIEGTGKLFKVADTYPDYAIGGLVMMLEVYDSEGEIAGLEEALCEKST